MRNTVDQTRSGGAVAVRNASHSRFDAVPLEDSDISRGGNSFSGGGSGHTPPLNAVQLPVKLLPHRTLPDNSATLALLTP